MKVQTDRQAKGQADRGTGRQTGREISRQRDRQTETGRQIDRQTGKDRRPVIAHINQCGKFGFFQAKDATLACTPKPAANSVMFAHAKRQKFHENFINNTLCFMAAPADLTVKMQIACVEQTTMRYI